MRAKSCEKARRIAEKLNLFKNVVVHGLSAFLLLSFMRYTKASFQILSRASIYREGGDLVRDVVQVQGNVEYFGASHLPYAIPAVFVLLVLSVPPPLLLISYPLLWKIKAKISCRVGFDHDDTTIWPIRKLLPLIDPFQGVFRDSRRMFAGLLFLWRVILTAIYAFSTNMTEFHLLTETALLIFLAIHVIARPYRQRLYNMIDSLMFANLAIINALTWYDSSSETSVLIVILRLMLMYLPLVYLAVILFLFILHKCGFLTNHIQQLLNQLTKEEEPNSGANVHTMAENQPRSMVGTDSDLFSRAAELNRTPSLVQLNNKDEIQSQHKTTTVKSA